MNYVIQSIMRKRKKGIILFLLLGLCNFGIAQSSLENHKPSNKNFYLNHREGVSNLSLRMGGTKYSNFGYYTFEYNKFITNKISVGVGPVLDFGLIENNVKYFDGTLNAIGSYTLYDLKDKLFLNGIVNVRAGLQNSKNVYYNESVTKFIYGGSFGFEIEYFFGKIGVTTQIQEIFTLNSPLGMWHYTGNLGIKYLL